MPKQFAIMSQELTSNLKSILSQQRSTELS